MPHAWPGLVAVGRPGLIQQGDEEAHTPFENSPAANRIAEGGEARGNRLALGVDPESALLVHRDLHPRERAALNALLTAEFAGVAELRAQAETALAVGGALVVDLVVDRSLPAANVGHRIPVQAAVDGEGYDGGLILYVDDGRLSGLEYWWVTEKAPAEFPPPSAVSLPVVTR